jgi:hypothetical protein
MAYNGLTKNYTAEGAIAKHRIVKVGAADYGVLQAAAATDKLIGVTTEVDADQGERVDVVHAGIVDLELGGNVAAGDLITSDADGKGVAAAPGAGANNRVIGIALIAGVAGDLAPVMLAPGSVQG